MNKECKSTKNKTQFMVVYNSPSINSFALLTKYNVDNVKKVRSTSETLKIRKKRDKGDISFLFVPNKVFLDGRVMQCFWFLIAKFAINVPKNADKKCIEENSTIYFTTEELASYLGLSRQKTFEVIKRAHATLKEIEWVFKDDMNKSSKNNMMWSFTVIIGKGVGLRRGLYAFQLHPRFTEYLASTAIEYMPKQFFDLNPKLYPNSIAFAIKMISHFNMNSDDGSDVALTVGSLLGFAPAIPSYKDEVFLGEKIDGVVHTGRVMQRIIKPFLRDVSILEEVGVIANLAIYNGEKKVDYNALKHVKHDDFADYIVQYRVENYPIKKKKKENGEEESNEKAG